MTSLRFQLTKSIPSLFTACAMVLLPQHAGAKPAGDTTVYSVPGKKRSHVESCRRMPKDAEERAKMTKMTLAEAEAKELPLCSRCPDSPAPEKAKPEESKPEEDNGKGAATVFQVPGKKRVHVEECKRFPKDPTVRPTLIKMTLAEAEAKGLALCSKCPGSSTPGKDKAE